MPSRKVSLIPALLIAAVALCIYDYPCTHNFETDRWLLHGPGLLAFSCAEFACFL